MGVGKSTAKMYVEKETGVTFRDVAGEEEAKESLTELVDFLKNPNKYREIGPCAVFLPVRVGFCGNVCRRRRLPCEGFV